MKNFLYLFLFVMAGFFCVACGGDEAVTTPPEEENNQTSQQEEAAGILQSLWNTTPLSPQDNERLQVFDKIQGLADLCSADYFEDYLNSSDQLAESKEKYDVLLSVYRQAFDRVLDEVANDVVEEGTAHIWMLYNMGYVIKTPSGCFAIDIMHRWADKLEPYLDFLCVTHNHQDHYDEGLIEAMLEAGKPVLSNYIAEGKVYTSTVQTTYTIGNFSIRTSITDHNNSGLSNFVTVFTIDCGADSNHLTLMHTGDSNYKPSQYTNILGSVNILIPRYAPNALTENNIIGTGSGQTQPDYVLLSHILELTHISAEESRWSLPMALERASQIQCDQTYVPMWGEKLVWKNNALKSE